MSVLGSAEATSIDALARATCPSPPDYGELPQLRTLFDATFQNGLERILQTAMGHHPSGPRHVEVAMGWIDKMPLAGSPVFGQTLGLRDRRVELGDALVITYDNLHSATGKLLKQEARAVLLQAKVARQVGHLTAPAVPLVGLSRSAKKELTLLSTWPKFDLFKSSGCYSTLLTGVDLSSVPGNPERFGWYLGAPGRNQSAVPPWSSWWVAGPPRRGAPMNASIGELLVAFLANRSIAGVPIGEKFVGGGGPLKDDWSKVCAKLISLVKAHHAPVHLFGANTSRHVEISVRAAAFLAAGAPGGTLSDLTLSHYGSEIPLGRSRFLGSSSQDLIRHYAAAPPRHRSPPSAALPPRWRPVLTVTVSSSEGRIEERPD